MSVLPAPGRRPALLAEPGWLAARYRHVGDHAIALELGVSRQTVARERARQGIPSRPAHRPRGAMTLRAVPTVSTSGADIAARIAEQSGAGGPAATYDLLLSRLVAVDEARRVGDHAGEEDGLIELAAACGLILDHLRSLRAA